MSFSLSNAAVISEHIELPAPARGYTRTRHQACRVSPGDLWCPSTRTGEPDQRPHTVTATRAKQGSIELVDQFGVRYRYPSDALLYTVILDPRTSRTFSASTSTAGQP